MKTVKESLLNRRSIRRYERRALDPEQMLFIYDAIRNTPTSYNGQQFSVIALTDPERKAELSEIVQQKQVKTCALFLIFCVDFHKLHLAAELIGEEQPCFQDTIDGYTVGVIDASLAMGNALIAAESMGLGTCCIGYTRTSAPEAIAEFLALPKGVAVVCGLAIGYPNEMPDMKPKLPRDLVIFGDRYRHDIEVMKEELKAYDEEVRQYNRHRSGGTTDNDWIRHILEYHYIASKYKLEEYLKDQDIKIKR
ncbi:MAG: nitroreductase family protein [Bacteroidales bacterium]|nr:nitroreductase family protein [Bacteroidales bacterium]